MLKTTPFKYQRKGYLQMEAFGGRALLADEMGLGKSLQSLMYADAHQELRPCLIICPAYLKENWQREIYTHLGERSVICYGRTGKPTWTKQRPPKYIIINYEILKKWVKVFRRMGVKLLIIDEVHRIKNRSSQQSQNVCKIGKRVDHILALSGTPLTKRPAELWATLNLLWPEKFKAFYTYAVRYCKPERKPWGIEYKGAKRLPELHEKLRDIGMIRRLKKDVLKDLPDKIHTIHPLAISNRKEYDFARSDFLKWLRQEMGKARALRAKKAQRMLKTGYLLRLAARLKLEAFCEWLDDFLVESDGKIIVFGTQIALLKELHERYARLSVLVNGTVPQNKRQARFDEFNHNPRCRIFFGNHDAAGVGWNGTVASTVAHYEFPWTSGQLNQATDRAHRIGQKNAVNVFYFPALNTIEESMCKMLQNAQGVLDAVLDGKEAADTELDLFDKLESLLLKGAT